MTKTNRTLESQSSSHSLIKNLDAEQLEREKKTILK